MSRVGKQPIEVPKGVKVSINGDLFVAEGPKGKVSQKLVPGIPVSIDGGTITVTREGEEGPVRAKHGLSRALLQNAITGAAEGWGKVLEIVGVGYKAELKGREIQLALGYSHPVIFPIPTGIDVEIEKNNKITVRGADRQQVGQVAAELRSLRPPDPYKAKGIRYQNEVIRRKEGKSGGKGGKK
jgi:large subunit ribosomal protein L6